MEKARLEQNTERIELAGSELNVANAQSFLKWLDRRGITSNMKILIQEQETKCQVSLQWGAGGRLNKVGMGSPLFRNLH
jgi:hypothetical protein